jgi:hypothetical protein
VANRQQADFFKTLKPTALGWKTTDLDEYDQIFASLRDECDQIHIARLNDRWLATMHLKDAKLEGGIEIVKLMQRRPGSEDKTGLDHLDFMVSDMAKAHEILNNEPNLKWTNETNNPNCHWISIWFENTEAKIRDGSVIDVCIAELKDVNTNITRIN